MILRIIEPLKDLADSWAAEKIFIQGAKVVLAGKTNAGKSSLFNALLKEDRAIVSDIHGTTRDWLEASLNFNGIPVSLYDTAGIRYTQDSIEAIGVERSLEMSRNADLILYLCDPKDILSAGSLNKEDSEFIKNAKAPVITVITKEDLLDTESKEKIKEILKAEKIAEPIIISSKASNGIKALSEKAYSVLAKNTGSSGFSKTASLGSERQRDAVQKALDVLKTAYQNSLEGFPLDLIVEDLEEALSFLGEITGEVRSDDILDKVFSGFCVGK